MSSPPRLIVAGFADTLGRVESQRKKRGYRISLLVVEIHWPRCAGAAVQFKTGQHDESKSERRGGCARPTAAATARQPPSLVPPLLQPLLRLSG